MKIEALAEAPLSGSMAEHWFARPNGDTWFKFELDDGNEWAGLFHDAGLFPVKQVLQFRDNRTALVNVGGGGYVIDVPSATLLYTPEINPLVEAVTVPDHDFIVAHDFTNVYALSRGGEIWRSDSIASDGIQFRHATSNSLNGRVWRHEAWHEFALVYNNWRVSVGDVVRTSQ